MNATVKGAIGALLHGKKFHVERTADGGAKLTIEGREHYSFTVTKDDLEQIKAFVKKWHDKLHSMKGDVGRPIIETEMRDWKLSPYKMGLADVSMPDFKYNPFKMGSSMTTEEREEAMTLGHTNIDPFKMGHTNIDPFKMGHTEMDMFKMGYTRTNMWKLGADEAFTEGDAVALGLDGEAARVFGYIYGVVAAAKKGNPKAIKAVKKVKTAAKKGDPRGKKALKTMRAADKLQKVKAVKKAKRVSRPASSSAPGALAAFRRGLHVLASR